MTVEELAEELTHRWDSHYPTVLKIVGNYALVYGVVPPTGGELAGQVLTDEQAQRIREAYDLAEYRAGRTPIPV